MSGYIDEIQKFRKELVSFKLDELVAIAAQDYNIRVTADETSEEIIEEILAEEYRIACK
jgi:hypothetical protein